MFFFLSVLSLSRKVITFNELENRTPQEICRNYFENYNFPLKTSCYTNGTGCNFGVQDEEDIDHACRRVNFFRTLVGLNALNRSYDPTSLKYVQEATVCLEKNDALTHNLRDNFECLTNEASKGAIWSNLAGGGCSTPSITSYMVDHNVKDLGHRRSILNPPLNKIVTASTNTRSALLVHDYSMMNKVVKNPPKIIAYPPPGPVPHELIFYDWQFSKEYVNDNNNNNAMPKDTKVTLVCDGENVPVTSEVMNPFTNQYPGIVKFRGGRWPSGTVCNVSIVSESMDTEWKYTVKAVDCSKVDMSVIDNGDSVSDDDDVDVVLPPESKNDQNGNRNGNGSGGKKGLNAGVIAGIVVGCVVVAAAVAFVLVYLLVIRKRNIPTSVIDPELQV